MKSQRRLLNSTKNSLLRKQLDATEGRLQEGPVICSWNPSRKGGPYLELRNSFQHQYLRCLYCLKKLRTTSVIPPLEASLTALIHKSRQYPAIKLSSGRHADTATPASAALEGLVKA